MHTLQYESADIFPEDVQSQLRHERERHAITKHMLQREQEKVRKVQVELDASNRLTSTLVTANRLNAEILKAVIKRIEPKVDKVARKTDLFTGLHGLGHHDDINVDGNIEQLLGGTAHGFKASDLHEASPQLAAPTIIDGHPSILYDVLACQRVDDSDRTPDMHSSNQQETDEKAASESFLGQSHVAEQWEQDPMHTTIDQGPDLPCEEGDPCLNPDQLENQGLGEFHSLDAAFESCFFPKPVEGSKQSCRSTDKTTSDDTLIDFLPGPNWSPKSKVVNGDLSESGTSALGQHQTSEEDHNATASKSHVAKESKRSTAEPVLGVEQVS